MFSLYSAQRSVDVVSYSQQTIACLQPSIFLCSSAFNDLCNVDAVVSRDVLIADTSSNAEAKTYNVMWNWPLAITQTDNILWVWISVGRYERFCFVFVLTFGPFEQIDLQDGFGW